MPATRDLLSERGDKYPFTFSFVDGSGDPVDLTDCVLFFTAKTNIDDSDDDAVISKSVSAHDDATGGITSLTLTKSDTENLSGSYYYDFQLVFANGEPLTILKGKIEFQKDVTRRTS